jgi:hypothetical protein
MSAINLKVNGRGAHTVDVDPATPLLYVLSDDLELRGPEVRLRLGPCGAMHGDREGAGDPLLRHAGEFGGGSRHHYA